MTYREALSLSTQGSNCCAKAMERLLKYMKKGSNDIYVPCPKAVGKNKG